ncbi:DNA topoisomerase IV, alpha subunit [Acaromyces ingoldii]|uniref:DNA topoisomerase (ATP-hydrolyzing) n=1 Tax=Acaromyces ingoldii TaxID=215250 RepID=A0A316YHA9_9BASI|nr:DNA topoisomerase IV, alpha subunit [Acaromyces ingoldii]PWN88234.1 DNA topoisomerase IV, alpha subunit [Acaromyces ingoldii]
MVAVRPPSSLDARRDVSWFAMRFAMSSILALRKRRAQEAVSHDVQRKRTRREYGRTLDDVAGVIVIDDNDVEAVEEERKKSERIKDKARRNGPMNSDLSDVEQDMIQGEEVLEELSKANNDEVAEMVKLSDWMKRCPYKFTVKISRILDWANFKDAKDELRAARLMKVVSCIKEAQYGGCTITKREIFYMDPTLFKKQANVNVLIDDICACVRCEPHELNVVAQSKALFIGGACFGGAPIGSDFLQMYCTRRETLVPPATSNETLQIHPDVKWVLVLEKEAVFHTFVESKVAFGANEEHPEGIIITAKGYADRATRSFLEKLASIAHSRQQQGTRSLIALPIDPYGMDIVRTYRYGSQSTPNLTRRLQWRGLKPSAWDIENILGSGEAFAPLTHGDRTKAVFLLRNDQLSHDEWKETARLLILGIKMELEVCNVGQLVSIAKLIENARTSPRGREP